MVDRASAHLAAAAAYPFLASAGRPAANAVLVADLVEATAGWWGGWRPASQELWRVAAEAVEELADADAGAPALAAVHYRAAALLEAPVRLALQAYVNRRRELDPSWSGAAADLRVIPEAIDLIVRDLAWAAVEAEIERPAFFHQLDSWYRSGRWPCGWRGAYPAGRVILL